MHIFIDYISMFASSFDILYLFEFLVLIFGQEKGTHDNPTILRVFKMQ